MKRFLIGSTVVFVGLAALAYVAMAGFLYTMQETLIFPAPGGISTAALNEAAAEVGATPIEVMTSDGVKLYGWYRSGGNQRAVVYFPGNAATVLGTVGLMRLVNDEGWDFAVIAYRGYPGSEGTPTEAGLHLDSRALWDFLRDEKGIAAKDIVIHGRSLGGGVAAGLAAEVKPGALVLESTFTSILDMAEADNPWFPVGRLLKHPFNTRERAASIAAPVLILHSDGDHTIPVSHGRALRKLFSTATYMEVPGREHNEGLIVNCPEGRAAYFELLSRLAAREAR